MAANCRGTCRISKHYWFVLMPMIAICVFTKDSTVLASDVTPSDKSPRRKLDDIGGSITIDCGIPKELCYKDEKTELHYNWDGEFIDTGVNMNISSNYTSQSLHKSLLNLRSFPQGNRNCYTLRPPEGKDTVYLIRAFFMYGNYDGIDQPPEFDLYVGVNFWDSVKFDNASHVVMKEILHAPFMDSIYVCLLNTGSGTPFVSSLELRHFHNSSYRTQSGSLVLYKRFNVGSTSNQIVRYKDDAYDRIWFPYNIPNCVSLNTSLPIDSLGETEYKLPSAVMRTALKPINSNDSLDFNFEIGDPSLEFYVYMHFAELEKLQENQTREFNIELNGNLWRKSVVPNLLHSTTIYNIIPLRGSKLRFSIYKTSNSTLPPLLNAMEIYIVRDFLQAATDQEDVHAIMDIKSSYAEVGKHWQGDPCIPLFSWNGLNCSNNGYDPPKIILLDLSSNGLKGKLAPSIANLKSLKYLDLSNNSLNAQVPDFLSQLPNLRVLNLTRNEFSGLVPPALLERSKNGSLSLSVGENPDLCLSAPCKKENKNAFILPLAVALPTSLVVLLALVTLWKFKIKKQGVEVVAKYCKGGSLKSNNRRFTYSEVVSITNNFQTVVGRGGFGTVYHGNLVDGTQVAVKILSPSSTQASTQFQTEAKFLMRIHHRNLASFIGYLNEGSMYGLVYEYMAKGNLHELLSDKTQNVLSWKKRLEIAMDVAQGLEYLHNGCKPPIIHRDVKPANILLNENLQAKIADFGFSKFFSIDCESPLSTAVVGTLGYLDPEYYASNRLTEKSDVYSFGIVLLELITGQPAIIVTSNENTHIVQWVTPILAGGDIRSILDPKLQENIDTNSVWKAMETAMACVPSISIQRPAMGHVLMELKECLAIEAAWEHSTLRVKEGNVMESTNSFEMNQIDLELEKGPEAR